MPARLARHLSLTVPLFSISPRLSSCGFDRAYGRHSTGGGRYPHPLVTKLKPPGWGPLAPRYAAVRQRGAMYT